MRVLIVEDEKRLAQNIARTMRERASCAIDLAHDGSEGWFMVEGNPYDLIILDLMLPKLSGLDLLKRFREHGIKTPVLILTARDDKECVIALLNAGADDYITKPFDMGEFMARSKSLIRRSNDQRSSIIRMDSLIVDLDHQRVFRNGTRIVLSNMEYRTIQYLAMKKGATVSKTELSEHLYDYNWEKFSNVIEVYISMLRRKIDSSSEVKLIHTCKRMGYSLSADAPANEEQGVKP